MTRQANILSTRNNAARRGASRVRTYERNSANTRVRSAIVSYDDFLEEEANNQENEAQRTPRSTKSTRAKIADARKKRAKEKAGRAFDRQFGGASSSSSANPGPRAAVYKGEMGRNARRSQRMQESMSAVHQANHSARHHTRSNSETQEHRGILTSIFTKRRRVVSLSVVVCLLIAGMFMYPAAKQYYTEMRHLAKVNAEYEAVVQRNAELASTRDYLQSNEGVEELAHEKYGWVNEGENSVLVYGLPEDDTIADTNLYIQRGSISAPETWYSVILDPFFGVEQ